MDPLDRDQGTLIARVTLPPGTAYDLRDALIEVTQSYTERGQPPFD